jgi:hypothetical protein
MPEAFEGAYTGKCVSFNEVKATPRPAFAAQQVGKMPEPNSDRD